MHREREKSANLRMRERIAHQAARIIAEDGLQNYALAKHKAARQIGAPDTHNLPDNEEVERALRDYQALYQRGEQSARLSQLRQQALDAMRLLGQFNPYLTGSVLKGTATRYSDINLQLFTDSAKEVELFLLARQVSYKSGEKRLYFGSEERALPVFTLLDGSAEINITVFAAEDIRQIPRGPSEKNARAHVRQVEALLEEG
ncbi:hypothetical protein SCD_n02939 [Sulfuricella denitrificans skB26]|uniref:Polymerase nucleotidyl transferase domain-containing protein n=2 Tax=Sulfuricella denitrificans TaxID=649841 RepID=S6ADU9_SULDS|nr:hypothetical protein SCD_n02939 [Sulfuricella denitrificans skB26]